MSNNNTTTTFHHQIIGSTTGSTQNFGSRTANRPASATNHRPASARAHLSVNLQPPQPQQVRQRPVSATTPRSPVNPNLMYSAHGVWREAPAVPKAPPGSSAASSAASPRASRPSSAHASPRQQPPPPPPPPPPTHALMPTPSQQPTPRQSLTPSQQQPLAGPNQWVEVLRPAIAWLFGFVDTQMSMAEGSSSSEILAEHRRALDDVCRQVGSVLRASPDGGLSASLWRATVALLTHFAARAEPLLGKVRALQKDAAASRVLDAKHQAERASWERERADLKAMIAQAVQGGGSFNNRRASALGRRRSSMRLSARRKSSFVQFGGGSGRMAGVGGGGAGGGGAGGEPGSPGISPGISAGTRHHHEILAGLQATHGHLVNFGPDPSEEGEDIEEGEEEEDDEEEMSALERQNEELHDEMVNVRTELVAERRRNEALQSNVEALREKLNARAALSRIQSLGVRGVRAARSGGSKGGGTEAEAEGDAEDSDDASGASSGSDASDDDADDDADSDDSGARRRRRKRNQRATLKGGSSPGRKGLMARAKDARLAKAASARAEMESELEQVKKELDRMQELFEAEVAKRQDLEALRAEVARRFSQAFVTQLEREQAAVRQRAIAATEKAYGGEGKGESREGVLHPTRRQSVARGPALFSYR